MAFDRNAQYGSRWDAPTTGHPQGAFKNRTDGLNDGSYLEREWMNDISALTEALIDSAGISLNGTADQVGTSQYMQGLVEQVSGRSYNYNCSNILNDYSLLVKSGQYAPASYFDGMLVEFRPSATNTAAATVNVAGLGIVGVSATSNAELVFNTPTQLRYNSLASAFDIVHGAESGIHVTTTEGNGGTIDQTFEQINFRALAQPSGPQCNMTYNNVGANTLLWTHNGTSTPRFHWYKGSGGTARMMELEGENPNANLYVYGDIFSGGSSVVKVPNLNDFAKAQTTNGYQKFPNGMIMQWLSLLNVAGGVYNWPISFNSAVYSIQSQTFGTFTIDPLSIISSTVSNFTVLVPTPGIVNWYVLGIGY